MKRNYLLKDPVEKSLFIFAIIALNMFSNKIVALLNLPLFMDTWATSLGTMAGGLTVGLVGGLIYNLLMSATVWNINSWVWFLVSILIAGLTWLFYQIDYLTTAKPMKLAIAACTIAIASAILSFIIAITCFGGIDNYPGTACFQKFFLATTHNLYLSAWLDMLIANLLDKVISLIFAVLIFEHLGIKKAAK